VSCNLNCRAHDRNIIQKVNTYLKDHDTKGLDITIGRFVITTLCCDGRNNRAVDVTCVLICCALYPTSGPVCCEV
jgi:monomeric isocitrate dehydrogenase